VAALRPTAVTAPAVFDGPIDGVTFLASVEQVRVRAKECLVWKLAVRQDRSATLVCEDGHGGVVYTENIPFPDFPMRAVTLWFSNGVICLPSE
jgi:hypothetical protein